MSQHADWGTMLVETDLDRELLGLLALWMPTYLAQAERERQLPAYLLSRPKPQSFQNALEDDTFPDAQLPAIVVTTAQTEGEPEAQIVGVDDAYSADYRVSVSAVVRGRTPPETREIAALMGGCVRRILTQRQVEFGTIHWRGSLVTPYTDATGQGRFLAAGVNRFSVFVDDVQSGDGPVTPEEGDPPYPPADPTQPDEPYDPLVLVREGGVLSSIYTWGNAPAAPGARTVSAYALVTPTTTASGDYTVGNVLQFNAPGQITGLRLWHPAGAQVTGRVASIYSLAGALLAQSVPSVESAQGWVDVALSAPYAVKAGDQLVIQYPVPGVLFGYATDQPPSVPELASLGGRYAQPSTAGFPTVAASGINYMADVVLRVT